MVLFANMDRGSKLINFFGAGVVRWLLILAAAGVGGWFGFMLMH